MPEPTLLTTANTGTTEGTIPVLGASGKLAASLLPSLALTETLSVANAAARLALTSAQAQGKIVVEADTGKSYGLVTGGVPATSGDWLQLGDNAVVAADISDSTAAGRSMLTAADAEAQVALLGAATPASVDAQIRDSLAAFYDVVDAMDNAKELGDAYYTLLGDSSTVRVIPSAEYTAYAAQAGSANLTIEERVALSNAIITLKESSSWEKISEIWLPMGANLTSALVKVKTPGALNMVATAMVSGDYSRAGGINTAGASGKFLTTDFIPSSSGLAAGEQGMGVYSLADTYSGVLGGTNGSGGNVNYLFLGSNGNSFIQSNLLSGVVGRGLKWAQQRGGNMEVGHNGILANSTALVATQAIGNITLLAAAGGSYGSAPIGGYVYTESLTPAEWGDVAHFFEMVNRACGRTIRAPDTISIAGDSIVNGYLVGADEKWPSLVSASLGLTNTNIGLDGYSISNETNVSNFLSQVSNNYRRLWTPRFRERMVIAFGVNDLNSGATAANFEADYRTIIAAVIDDGNYDPRDIILCSPSWVAAAGANYTEARQFAFADVVKAISEDFGTLYVDMTRGAIYGQTSGFQVDLIHPNASGHALLASDFLQIITE